MSAGHELTLHRYQRGRSAVRGGGMQYGYRVVCSCGWQQRVNGTKREAERTHRTHVKNDVP